MTKLQGRCLDCKTPIRKQQKRCLSCHSSRGDSVVSDWKLDPKSGIRSGFRLKTRIRNYLLDKSNHQCSQCGWNEINPITGKSPLEIDHIDGNCENAEESNLRVLCPNCHSLTSNWKFLNKGNGNRRRHSYFGLIKEP